MLSTRDFVLQNTKTRSGAGSKESISAFKSCGFCPWVTEHKCCSIVAAVCPVLAISMRSGSLSSASMVEVIDAGSVAEKSNVWCALGSCSIMRRTLGQKPMSSMRSASSSTSTWMFSRLVCFLSRRSIKRPGVATSTSQPFCSAVIWCL